MQLDRGWDGEDVLVRHESTGRNERRLRGGQLTPFRPGSEQRVDRIGIEAGNRGAELRPGIGATPEESRAARREQPLVRAARKEVGAELRDRAVLLFVEDTGPGLSEEELPRIFDRYWRGDSAHYKGMGLGLTIAKGIVDAHGGRIWAESKVGVGSRFSFTIPQ